MKILGIATSHDSGAAVIEDGLIIAAANEERFNREKLYEGLPIRSISECLKIAGMDLKDMDVVVFANSFTNGGFQFQRDFRAGKFSLKKVFFDSFSYFRLIDTKIAYRLYSAILKYFRNEYDLVKLLRAEGLRAPIRYVDHHLCHAASAYYTSPFNSTDKVLVVTTDGAGDGLSAGIYTLDRDGLLRRRNETTFFHSPAASFYSNVTYNLGFRPMRHEGKITGLAAYGRSEKTIGLFRKYLDVDLKKLEYRSRLGCYGRPAEKKIHSFCRGHKREDIAAGLQKRIEEVSAALVREAAYRYGCNKVCLAGGLFANVRLNQVIFELPEIKDVYIHPHMGDGGVAVGAALSFWADYNKEQNKVPLARKINNAYLGPSFANDQIKNALDKSSLKYQHFDDVELETAKMLSQGKVVARFDGRMEYGPRALCNRSILYQATDPTVNNWLNKRLQRTEFMPFAPVVLFEEAADYFRGFNPNHSFASQFMTITYRATDKCKREAPAVVHLDGTARPQVLKKEVNPSMYRVLEEYNKLTGLSVLINTSFNMHEEPIVCTPQDAIRAFQLGSLDILAMGNYIIYNK